MEKLHASGNKLIHQPNSFGQLIKLIELNLSNSHLTIMPISFEELQIIKLNLESNFIINIEEETERNLSEEKYRR